MDAPLAKAEQGYTNAQYAVGLAYLIGETPDPAKAKHWLCLSAGKGHILARELLAYGHAHGMFGLPSRDEFQAIEGAQSTLRESSGAGNSPVAERLRKSIE
jgi:TPR repeat protein